jgi:hypothetical protein
MSLTEPAYSLPIVLDGTESITITLTGGSTSDSYTAFLTEGTYYNWRITDITGADSLTKMIDDVLDAAESTAGNTASWVESEPSSGLSHRMQLDRTGDTGDVVSSMTLSSDALRQAMGFSELVVNNVTELSNSADDTTLEGSYQRGYLWVPRTILGFDERIPISEVAGSITAVGRAVVDGYGEYERIRHVIEFVPGPLVYTDKAADADFQGVQVEGLALGDDTAPLDQFWTLARTGADGAPPIIQYVPDTAAPSVFESIVIADVDWLADMDNVAEITTEAPLLYRVRINAMESVGTSFTSTGPTIGTNPGLITEYDTYVLLPTDVNGLGAPSDGAFGAVTTTAAAGVYTYVSSVGGFTLDMWLPSWVVSRGITYVENGSGDPCRLSAKIGGESVTTLTSRGWTVNATGTSTVTTSGDQVLLDCTATAPNNAQIAFNPLTVVAGDVFCVLEVNSITHTGAGPELGALTGWYDASRAVFVTHNQGNVKNKHRFTGFPAALGHGDYSGSAYDRLFCMGQWSTVATGSDMFEVWPANIGRKTGSGHFQIDRADMGATATTQLLVQCNASSGSVASMRIQEVHLFQLGTP